MAQQTEPRAFAEYEGLLWRVLATLARRGYFVPPGEARDVMHDFYVEAWAGLEQRFDPSYGTYAAYVAGSFYRFARRRLAEMARRRGLLDDLSALETHAAPEAGPADLHEQREERRLLADAMQRLPRAEREILSDYLYRDEHSERALAARHAVSRYEVRRRIASALATISKLMAPAAQGAAKELRANRDAQEHS